MTADSKITPREAEVLRLVGAGLNDRAIAARLFLSPYTVREHTQNAIQKLGARTRAHAVTIALKSGDLRLDEIP